MSSNFFQFTQIWHFCNGLNPNKAQMSFVWGWNRQMGKKGETEKLNFQLGFPKNDLTISLTSGIFSIFCQMVRDPERPICFYVLCATSAFTHGQSIKNVFVWEQQQPVERLSAVLIPGVPFCKIFFYFLELFLVTLLHGKVFFFL